MNKKNVERKERERTKGRMGDKIIECRQMKMEICRRDLKKHLFRSGHNESLASLIRRTGEIRQVLVERWRERGKKGGVEEGG